MSKKKDRREISVRGSTYDKLKASCEAKGVVPGSQVDQWVAEKLGHPEERHLRPARKAGAEKAPPKPRKKTKSATRKKKKVEAQASEPVSGLRHRAKARVLSRGTSVPTLPPAVQEDDPEVLSGFFVL